MQLRYNLVWSTNCAFYSLSCLIQHVFYFFKDWNIYFLRAGYSNYEIFQKTTSFYVYGCKSLTDNSAIWCYLGHSWARLYSPARLSNWTDYSAHLGSCVFSCFLCLCPKHYLCILWNNSNYHSATSAGKLELRPNCYLGLPFLLDDTTVPVMPHYSGIRHNCWHGRLDNRLIRQLRWGDARGAEGEGHSR